MSDEEINHPQHYTSSAARCERCGEPVECIEIAEHHDFCIGNVIKYCWRAGRKVQGTPLESELKDLRKARWYLDRKIARLERLAGKGEGDG